MFKAGHVLDGAFANQTAAEFYPAISANYSVDAVSYTHLTLPTTPYV